MFVIQTWLLPFMLLLVATVVAFPLSRYMAWIMDGKYRPWRVFGWFERHLDSGPQTWKQYTASLLIFNVVLFVFGYIVLSLQPWMPLNPRGLGMLAPTTIFSSVASFMTNTDLQHYSGDQHLSNFSQIVWAIANLFLSAAIGLSGAVRDHPRAPERFAPRQLLPRHVAGGRLHVRARRHHFRSHLHGPGQPHDLSELV